MGSQAIIDFARQLKGSHYLWGSGGDSPLDANGVFYRPRSVTYATPSTDITAPMVFAAQCDMDGHFVCAGRFKKIPGGRYGYPLDWDLGNYLYNLQSLPSPSMWQPYFGHFSPRVVQGRNVSNNGRIVWGEDCRGIRHFDCISFVNFVLSATTKPNWGYSIEQYNNNTSGLTTEVDLTDPATPGDILLRNVEHIALLCENNFVIQAQDHATGVHEDEQFVAGSWTARFRVLANQLLDPNYP